MPIIRFYRPIIFFLLIITISAAAATKEEVQARILAAVQRLPSGTRSGILIFNPVEQDTIFALNHTMSMIPASNNKLFTTATALNLLGGDFEILTRLLTNDKDTRDGVINGDVYIKGYGNAVFNSSDLESFASKLKQMGIIRITGRIIGDDSYFDDVYSRDDWITDEVANVKLPPISALVVDRNRTISYRKKRKRMVAYATDVKDPALNAASLLNSKLAAAGITSGGVSKGVTPSGADVLCQTSILLKNYISMVNKNSDNFMAECLFKIIGAESSKIEGNAFYSTQAILNFIDDNGIYVYGTSVVDGSGISRFDQVTVSALGGLLEKMYFDIANYDDFYNSLSIAGVDGTLRHRLIGTSAERNLHGKTGTLNGVSSLTGYVRTRKGDDLIVSFIFEFTSGGASIHKHIQDEIIRILAEWN